MFLKLGKLEPLTLYEWFKVVWGKREEREWFSFN